MDIFDISFIYMKELGRSLRFTDCCLFLCGALEASGSSNPHFYVHVRGGKCLFDRYERINMLIHTLRVEGDFSHFGRNVAVFT